ncbi:LEAF RUST 10 DISEASE-RESISTANCE LOCUS RECEPTOR-LIKE PROTEIN KINASE-like 2.4 [Mercurialis annua]|uniref:LEAF RUST 10 DISEASE-RESISTANCE LOCUS RECEPTOR-LIKE PROTEIN KINASE-like 2.4 n=1 Tax=Mercurialis annua TaxID=3986 RepID=UPI00215DDE84|nr:LEAF RUST 10 DISEASE-RESISTANCE LOCUS RECEPTOR-LIKE PROTEIN KINASE-like 2.4 [Mercurialis annua]
MKSQHLQLILHKFLIFLLVSISLSNCNIPDQLTTCVTTTTAYRCGTLRGISYPFWGGKIPEYCGNHMFYLMCIGDIVPVIGINKQLFTLLDIDQDNYTMSISLFGWNPCPDSYKNYQYYPSDHRNFAYTDTVRNLTLVYGCPMLPFMRKSNFTCGVHTSSPNDYNYYADEVTWEMQKEYFKACKRNVTLPVSKEALMELLKGTINVQEALSHGFKVEFTTNRHACTHCKNSLHGYCGSNVTNHRFICLTLKDHDQPDTDVPVPGPISDHYKESHSKKLKIGIELAAAVVLSLCIATFSFCIIRRTTISNKMTRSFCKTINHNDKNIEMLIRKYKHVAPQRYSYSDIKKMTNSFKVKLGEGGYGSVYKGKLQDDRLVAVKLLNKSQGIGEEFINEVASISQTCHVNIVSLIGFCFQDRKRALVYEFMVNGSLDKCLHDGNITKECLGWKIMHQIAIGIARGLEYLHRGCHTRILHLDIKPHNILLDEDFCPKIADFGLSKLSSRKQSIVSMEKARGTIGYIAPEVYSRTFGNVSHKSDVYSYGMMVLEMVSGRKNKNVKEDHRRKTIFFPHWIYERLRLGNDLGLCSVVTNEDEEIARNMVLVGLRCIQTNPSNRPSIGEVLVMLEVSTEVLTIPPQPFQFSPQNSDSNPSPTSDL